MTSYLPEIKDIVLAALLHDIGKFGQRAGSPRSEEMIPTYCPANRFGKPQTGTSPRPSCGLTECHIKTFTTIRSKLTKGGFV
jgi:hypothetical protein